MKVFNKNLRHSIKYFTEIAVKSTSKEGGEFEWQIAMGLLEVMTGHAPIIKYEKMYENGN